MKISFRKKLSQAGLLSLHVLIPIVLAIIAVGGVGAYVITKSKAASALTSSTCYLRGRAWSSTTNTCTKVCVSGAGSIVVSSPYDYCSGALSKISYTTCVNNSRKWLDVGCARRWQQTNLANAPQCATTGSTYTVLSTYDKCITTTKSTSGIVACKITASPLPAKGISSTYTITVTNGTSSALKTVLGEMGGTTTQGGKGLITDISLGDIAAGTTKSGSYTYKAPTNTTEIFIQGGTPSSDFSNCRSTWTL